MTPALLRQFFVGWPAAPSPERRVAILRAAPLVCVAWQGAGHVAGFVTALTDGTFAASIPLLEVAPRFQRRGIGSALIRRMLERLRHCYMIDLSCDPELIGFHERLGMTGWTGAVLRNRVALDPAPDPSPGT